MNAQPTLSIRTAGIALACLGVGACGGGGGGLGAEGGEPPVGAADGIVAEPIAPSEGAPAAAAPGTGAAECAPVSLTQATDAPVACAPLDDAARSAVLDRVNAARAEARSCGAERFRAAPPLSWNPCLEAAALGHSSDMAGNDFFSHTGSDGSSIGARATAAGLLWSAVGENIAAGHDTAGAAVRGWIESPGHCANLMNPRFASLGLACTSDPGATFGTYWTQVFARSR